VFGDTFELGTPAERLLSRKMGCYWSNFAHSGDPNVGPAEGCNVDSTAGAGSLSRDEYGAGLEHWPAWTAAEGAVLVLNTTVPLVSRARFAEDRCKVLDYVHVHW
jgi:hypothetical protein